MFGLTTKGVKVTKPGFVATMAPLTCRPIDLFSTWMLGVAIDVEQDHLRSLYEDIFRLIGGFVLSVHELSQPDVISLCSNGCAEAMLERGDRYMWGSFLHQIHCNFNHAATWFQKSAALGNANAHATLAVLYWKGNGVLKDRAVALFHAQESFRLG